MLTLVVGGAAAVPTLAALGQGPGVEAVLPLVIVTGHHITVAVAHDRGQIVALAALGDQKRPAALDRVVESPAGKAQGLEAGLHFGA